jgi:hypothetical protein
MAYPSPISHDRAAEVSSPARVPARGRAATLGLGGLFLLLVVAVYADPLFFRRNFGGRDLLGYGLPIESVIHDAYARGRLPIWNPWIAGGRPLLANPNAGALYPVRPLLSLVPFPLAFRIFPLLHWALAGLGMIALLRVIGVSKGGAWIGAVTYVFSGVVVSEVFYNNNHPGVMLIPWILWAFARRFGSAAKKALALSLLFGLDFLAGDVFTIGIALGACLLWILVETEARERWRLWATLGAALVLAGLLALPQIVAALLWVPETNRAVLGMRMGEVVLFSVSPFRLLELVIPFPFGETWSIDSARIWGFTILNGRMVGFFTSLYAGALAFIALASMGRERPAGARFSRALFLGGLLLAVPGSLLPARWGNLPSPLSLRYPEKFSVALIFALAIYSGLAFDLFRLSGRRPRWLIVTGAVLALLAAGAWLFPDRAGLLAVHLVGMGDPIAPIAAHVLPAALAEAGLLWMATVIALDLLGRSTRARLGISLALLTLVPIAANRKIARTYREEALFSPTPYARFLARADPNGQYRTMGAAKYAPASELETRLNGSDEAGLDLSRRNWYEYTPCLWRRGTIFNIDYDNGDLSRLASLRRVSFEAARYRDSQAFFGALALKWAVRLRDQEPLPGYHRVGGNAMAEWDEHERAYPGIRLVTSWREETGALGALAAMTQLAPGEIAIESGLRVRGQARPGRVRIREESPERLLLEAEAPDPTWLFVLRGFWSYRTVLLDGKPAEDVPAQLAFSAVRVPAGRHTIEWRERLPGWSVSRWGPVLFLLVLVGVLARPPRNHRRGPSLERR